jgi:hypothetical protein
MRFYNEFWALDISARGGHSPLQFPSAQSPKKSYFALIYKKEGQKETNNKDENKLHHLTACMRFRNFA